MIGRIARAVTGLAVVLLVSGCLDSATTVLVKKDGSGLITEIVYMNAAMEQMMQGMAAAMGGDMEEAEPDEAAMPELDEEEYKEKASKLGEGVRYVSAKRVKKAGGDTGVAVTYAFDDVTKIRISPDPAPSGMPGGDEMGEDSSEDKPITFGFVKGGKPKLLVNLPQDKPSDDSAEVDIPYVEDMGEAEDSEAPSPQELQMMKQMFSGFRFRLTVEVEGQITDSNAAHVSGGNTVTLYDVDFGKIVDDEKSLMKFATLGSGAGMQDPAKAAEQLAEIPGLKIETSENLSIEFK
ncbi:hypothetical protein ACFLSJ_06395 [Verrucomicrobiota bacterium]